MIYTTNSIFFVVPTKSNLATVARGRMFPIVLRKSMIVYDSLYDEFSKLFISTGTKHLYFIKLILHEYIIYKCNVQNTTGLEGR